jgi:hypothetical protein
VNLWRGKTDLDWYIWFLRIHDYGFGRLHIHELVLDLFYGFQGKFLRFFLNGRPRVKRVVLNSALGAKGASYSPPAWGSAPGIRSRQNKR